MSAGRPIQHHERCSHCNGNGTVRLPDTPGTQCTADYRRGPYGWGGTSYPCYLQVGHEGEHVAHCMPKNEGYKWVVTP